MLTTDLLRIRIVSGEVRPGWLQPELERDLTRAQRLVDVFVAHEGKSRGDLEDALSTETGQGRDYRILRGLAKLLLDCTEIEVASTLSPTEVRAILFELAAASHPISPEKRAAVVAEAASRLGARPIDVESALYADLAANQRVKRVTAPTAEALLHRYNVALVQGVLLRAHWLAITLPGATPKRLRQVLRYLKLHRLMHETEPLSGGGWRLVVDGPLAVLTHSTRYGVAMAAFLPALLLCEEWALEAEYQPKKGARKAMLHIDSGMGLRSHYRDTGTWTAPEETALFERLQAIAAPWTVSTAGTIVDLDGRDVLVPDLVVRDPETGAEAMIEIVWAWRRRSISARWELLREVGPKNLVLALCTGRREDPGAPPDLAGPVHCFRSIPNARALLDLAKAAAVTPSSG